MSLKKYFYFGTDKNGAVVPVFECVSPDEPTPEQVNTIYHEMIRAATRQGQAGIGIPRPTHYASLDLIEVAQTDVVEDKPILVHGHEGQVVH